jgi:phage terminase large subunit-like protein
LGDAVLDEYASMRPEVWPYVVLPTLADLAPLSRALFIGSPSGRNHFYALWEQATKGKPGWKAWTFRTIDSPLIPAEEIEAARDSMSSHAFKQEFEADFGDSADCPLNPDLLKTSDAKPFDYRDEIVIGVRLQTFERNLQDRWDPTKVDMTTICVARIKGDKAHILDMERDRFTVREMCTRLLALERKYRPMVFAIESKQYNAIKARLEERELKFGRPIHIEPITEQESTIVTRCTWTLQPMLESGRLTFADGDYLMQLKGQMGTYPDDGADDDMIRALAYACEHVQGFEPELFEPWRPLDTAIGI